MYKRQVALLSASSSFAPWGRAGHTRPDFQGRPGLSPLRYQTRFLINSEQFQAMRQIEESLGIRAAKEQAKKMGWDQPDDEKELSIGQATFVESDMPGIETKPNAGDVKEITKWIKDARRQADWVLFTLHAHESQLDRTVPVSYTHLDVYKRQVLQRFFPYIKVSRSHLVVAFTLKNQNR